MCNNDSIVKKISFKDISLANINHHIKQILNEINLIEYAYIKHNRVMITFQDCQVFFKRNIN